MTSVSFLECAEKKNSVFVSIKSKCNLSNSEQNYRMLITRVVLEIKRA